MELYLDDEDEPEMPDNLDFSPYSVEYIFETGNQYVQFGTLPSGKGWNEEDAAWTDALQKWLSLRRYLKHQRDKNGKTSDPFKELGGDADVGGWERMMTD